MNTKKIFTTSAAALVLALALTACSQGADTPGGQHVPSETDPGVSVTTEPSAEPTAVENTDSSFTVDPAAVTIPESVTAAYEDTTTLVADALAAASLVNETKELQYARTGDEMGYWSVYRESMTPEAYTRLEENVAGYVAGDKDAEDRLMGLAPFTYRDGGLGEVDGVTYAVGEQGVRVNIVDTPTVEMIDDPAYGRRVAVKVPEEVRAFTDDGNVIVFTLVKSFYMVPGGDGWLVDGYNPVAVSDLSVEAA